MRAIAAIPPYASRPNSWPNKIDVARYEKYFPDGGGRRGRRPVGIIPRWTGKAIAGNRAPLRVCFRCRWVPGDVDGTASHLPERTGFACCNRRPVRAYDHAVQEGLSSAITQLHASGHHRILMMQSTQD
jgi:hypothetical protein